MCVADCAARTDGGARATAGCDINSLADFDAAADLDADRAADLDFDAAPNLNAAIADSTGHCC